jgi:hypothetical protein
MATGVSAIDRNNAALMAAAPALLDACRLAMVYLCENGQDASGDRAEILAAVQSAIDGAKSA